MKGIKLPLRVKPYKLGRRKKMWVLMTPMVYASRAGLLITVPTGFKVNLTNLMCSLLVPKQAAVIHQFLYSTKGGRLYADNILKEMMQRAGKDYWSTAIIYYCCRIFGWAKYYLRRRS